jgi:hypothetical protein
MNAEEVGNLVLLAFQQQPQHYACMAKSVTIRDVPDEAHAELASRAALAGQSLQEYLRAQLVDLANRPDMTALLKRIEERKRRTRSHLSIEKMLEYRDLDRR